MVQASVKEPRQTFGNMRQNHQTSLFENEYISNPCHIYELNLIMQLKIPRESIHKAFLSAYLTLKVMAKLYDKYFLECNQRTGRPLI